MTDFSPIVLKQIEWEGRILIADPPLQLQPVWKGWTTHPVVEDASLGLVATGRTRRELLNHIADAIFHVWDTFGKGDPEDVSEWELAMLEACKKRFTLVTDI